MAKITRHKTNDMNKGIDISSDERDPDYGNASHVYQMVVLDRKQGDPDGMQVIKFQRGGMHEPHTTGISNEALLAILIDRLDGFQSGKFACRENALAKTKLEEALMWLQERTRQRLARGVEGKNEA